ncbi:MAG: ATP-binding cassette domain-containing protein [Ruminococcaceae bacterium]|nr:ATP-binding cassette domain-containing protein [Oscillospiraceae bacterium]
MIQTIYVLSILLFTVGFSVITECLRRRGAKLDRLFKAVGLVLAAVAFAAYMKAEPAIYDVQGRDMFSPFGSDTAKTVLSILIYWFTHAATLVAILSVFFNYETLKNLARFFAGPMALVAVVASRLHLQGIVGESVFTSFNTTYVFMALQLALILSISVYHFCTSDKLFPSGRAWLSFLYALPFALLCIMPSFVPQALIGFRFTDASIQLYGLTEAHRYVLYGSIILPMLIFFAIRDKDVETKRFLMIFLSLAWMWVYLGRWTFTDLAVPWNWPLHLCNTAMFLIPLCLIFRMRRLFNFCLFINVMGALLAMIMAEELGMVNAIATERISYWINHYAAFFMPVLLVALKIFKRPGFKEWIWAVIAFAVYFFAMLIVNAWFTNYDTGVDFFFLNSDFIVDKLGKWAERTRELVVTFNIKDLKFTFYPVYQTIFFIVYVGVFTVGIRFIYELLFRAWDNAENRRERERSYKMMKKELNEFLGGKPVTEPVSGNSEPCIELKHFSKKYDANKHYSVHDVSFKVNPGEVFGFLGPNGAGKSTIIKSIVGMQTITEGNIEVCGYDVDRQAIESKLRLGFVPDHYALYENLTGREYINYIADLYRVDIETRDATIEKYVERFQLSHSFDNQMKTYSHGMKQKITIMAALVHNPKVWILDEPLTGLDPTSIHEVKECMKDHAAAGNIVFFSSHIIDVVEKICDRIAIIKGGKLRACVSVADLEEKGIDLENFYLSVIDAADKEDFKPIMSAEEALLV